LPNKPAEDVVVDTSSEEESGKSKRSIVGNRRSVRNSLDDELVEDLEPAAQSIRGYASRIPPYSNSNTRFSDHHKKRPGRPLGSDDKDFKPYNSAFDKQTAQKLSSIKVTTNARRFGFRGR
jgi:hypothetical protein